MKISVVVNTFNSERFLDRCLSSVDGFDEIVLCDMHSTDSTIPIAEPLDLPEPFARFSYAYRCQIGIYRVAYDQEIRAHGPQPVP